LGLTAVGVFADIERLNRLGIVFQACYFVGCLLAVVMVQRKGLFGPMVQPPLILAIAVPGVVLAAGSLPSGGGMMATALAVGTPLINGFPTMAITTGLVLAIGAFRLVNQRRPSARRTT
jgi:acid phosphatase family membrane protein YuiD